MAARSRATSSEISTELLMLGYLCIKDADNLNEKVTILDRFGLADNDIATICGCKAQSVRNSRQRVAKGGRNT